MSIIEGAMRVSIPGLAPCPCLAQFPCPSPSRVTVLLLWAHVHQSMTACECQVRLATHIWNICLPRARVTALIHLAASCVPPPFVLPRALIDSCVQQPDTMVSLRSLDS